MLGNNNLFILFLFCFILGVGMGGVCGGWWKGMWLFTLMILVYYLLRRSDSKKIV